MCRLSIKVLDEDGGALGGDDPCDANPAAGRGDLRFTFAVVARSCSGDLTGSHDTDATAAASEGSKPDSDRVAVRLVISTDEAGAPWSFRAVAKAVGPGMPNDADDVTTVQELLNAVPAAAGGPATKLTVDGLFGTLTEAAIRGFQRTQFGSDDGIVSAGKRTVRRLNAF